jgi:hypothetical protein
MADLARYLPLSLRPNVDESGVTGDWGPRLAELLVSIDAMIAGMDAETAARPDVVAVRDRLSAAVGAIPSGRRVRVPALGAVLVEAIELARAAARPLAVDHVTSGAVALDRSLRAPLPIRAVIRRRTVRATDAGWEFGNGPPFAGTADELVLFLYGRAGVPATAGGT